MLNLQSHEMRFARSPDTVDGVGGRPSPRYGEGVGGQKATFLMEREVETSETTDPLSTNKLLDMLTRSCSLCSGAFPKALQSFTVLFSSDVWLRTDDSRIALVMVTRRNSQ